jgi:hypothetical protein
MGDSFACPDHDACQKYLLLFDVLTLSFADDSTRWTVACTCLSDVATPILGKRVSVSQS